MSDALKLGLFGGEDKISADIAWHIYNGGQLFNTQINLDDTVRVNENFFVGKQWEGVKANGLPTPTFNILKRVVGFTVATITSDNIKVNATALANTPATDRLIEPVRIVNEEFEALTEHNNITSLVREFARNAAVDGDGCIYTYWDDSVDCGGGVKGAIKSEIIDNTRVFFGNPNDRNVQSQPYITIMSREICRNVRRRAKANGISTWTDITPDVSDEFAVDSAKYTDDKTTVLLTLWRDENSGTIHAFESTRSSAVRNEWDLGIKLYPLCWLSWDYIKDCYHGQAMLTGLIPNQIFINKAWAMTMLSMMRGAQPKVLYDKSRIKAWDNRVGGAIGINGGDVNSVAKILEPAAINPQVSQYIQLAIEQTEQSLGATKVALGDTRPDNTSAIVALQRAAATPSEMTKQNLYKAVEDLFRIYLDFMGEYYGRRLVDTEAPAPVMEAMEFAGQDVSTDVLTWFDFGILKENPMMLKLDVGASSYYSEIASMQTLDNLLMNGHITPLQYLERIPDGYIPRRRALIEEMKQASAMPPMDGMPGEMPPEGMPPEEAGMIELGEKQEVVGGKGFGALQRAVAAGQDVR